jgi:hypothetical protein
VLQHDLGKHCLNYGFAVVSVQRPSVAIAQFFAGSVDCVKQFIRFLAHEILVAARLGRFVALLWRLGNGRGPAGNAL